MKKQFSLFSLRYSTLLTVSLTIITFYLIGVRRITVGEVSSLFSPSMPQVQDIARVVPDVDDI